MLSKKPLTLLLLLLLTWLTGCASGPTTGPALSGQGSTAQGSNTPTVRGTPQTTAPVSGGLGAATPISITGHGEATATPSAAARGRPTPSPGSTSSGRSGATATPVPTLASVGSGPYGTPPAESSQESQLRQQLFALINHDRASQGLPAYTLDGTLSAGARLHSWNMAHCGLSHACSGEAAPCDRISAEGITWNVCGENVGYASASPDAWGGVQLIESSMLNEQPPNDGHRRNLLSSSFHRVGIGIYLDSQGYVWVTEDFTN
ncbi:CAP domain-containing protein [Thermogemmatispora carboxidivorans]|uniref:CAP domain-containing protein n=1 Tax=Thermogemmatispora carboxidivorans TaxID=1382306 RepID=UPI00069A0E35|nr:CAP domain-containing protein [Thermogemmatispora carboxidivorans]